MSALEGDRTAAMKTLGDAIRALDAPDQWRILATTLNALGRGGEAVCLSSEAILGGDHEVRWYYTAAQWRYTDLT